MLPLSILVALLALPAAGAAQAFDLVCAGQAHDNDGPRGDWRRVVHVDLGAGLYCEDECRESTRIRSADDRSLVFQDGDGVFRAFDRTSGRYAGMTAKPDPQDPREPILLNEQGECRLAPISAHPAPPAGP